MCGCVGKEVNMIMFGYENRYKILKQYINLIKKVQNVKSLFISFQNLFMRICPGCKFFIADINRQVTQNVNS